MSPEATLVLSVWSFEPTIWLGVATLVALYALAAGPWRSRLGGDRIGTTRIVSFLLGALIMLLALVSPMDEISDTYLFSAHMVQHLLLTMVAVPLLLMGTPGWVLRPLLGFRALRLALRVLTIPVVGFALFNINFMVWHVPVLYEATLENESIHIVEHLLFIGTAFLNWWPILGPLPELPHLPEPGQILYLFLDAVPSTILGAVLIFASSVLYPTYYSAPRIFGISAIDDQLISGLIMAMPGAMIYLLALSIVFFRWLGKENAHSTSAAVKSTYDRTAPTH